MYHGIEHAHCLPHHLTLRTAARLQRHAQRRVEHAVAVHGIDDAGSPVGSLRFKHRHDLLAAVLRQVRSPDSPDGVEHTQAGTLFPAPLFRCHHAVHLRAQRDVPLGSPLRGHRHRGHRGSLPLGADSQPLHTPCVAADEPHRVHRQRPVHSLFPHRRGHAHQCRHPVQGHPHAVDCVSHRLLRHLRQGRGRLPVEPAVPFAQSCRPHDVRTDVCPCRRCHRHGHDRHAPRSQPRPIPGERRDTERRSHHDSYHVHHIDADDRACRPADYPEQPPAQHRPCRQDR